MSKHRQLDELKIYTTSDHDLKILSNCTHLKARTILTEFSDITCSMNEFLSRHTLYVTFLITTLMTLPTIFTLFFLINSIIELFFLITYFSSL